MQKDVVRNWQGKIIGYIETDNFGNKTVRDFYRKVLGRYDKRQNVTRDFYGRVIAKGDQCSMLFKYNY